MVPAYAQSWYFIRAPERSQVDHIQNWILKIAEGAAMMSGTTQNSSLLTGCYNKLSVKGLADLVVTKMREVGPPTYTEEELHFAKSMQESVRPETILESLKASKREDWQSLRGVVIDRSIPDPWGVGEVMGASTDVADVSWQAPTIEFSTATWPLGIPSHSWQIVTMGKSGVAHKSLIFAAKIMAACVLEIMKRPSLLETLKREWEESKQGIQYSSPLPSDLKPPFNQFLV